MTKKNNANSARRKLIPAVGMLVVSAMMLSSSTYAWFSMNDTVTATGIQMTATAPSQLLIKGSASGAKFKAAIAFDAAIDSAVNTTAHLTGVVPVAYKNREAQSGTPTSTGFKKLTTAGAAKVDELGKVDGAAGTLTGDDYVDATPNEDFFYDTFTLKYAGEYNATRNQPTVAITFDDALSTKVDSTLVDSLHVALVDDATTPHVYDFDMSDATYDTATGRYTFTAQNITAFTSSDMDTEYKIFVFFDGEDADNYNDKAVNMSNYTFTLTFNLPDTSTQQGGGTP